MPSRSLPQELRALTNKLPTRWMEYDATPEHQVERRFQILKEILTVVYAAIQLAEGLEAAGEKVGATWGRGKNSPKDFYALAAKALTDIRRELVDGARRAVKTGSKSLASEMIDAASEVLERLRQLADKSREALT